MKRSRFTYEWKSCWMSSSLFPSLHKSYHSRPISLLLRFQCSSQHRTFTVLPSGITVAKQTLYFFNSMWICVSLTMVLFVFCFLLSSVARFSIRIALYAFQMSIKCLWHISVIHHRHSSSWNRYPNPIIYFIQFYCSSSEYWITVNYSMIYEHCALSIENINFQFIFSPMPLLILSNISCGVYAHWVWVASVKSHFSVWNIILFCDLIQPSPTPQRKMNV